MYYYDTKCLNIQNFIARGGDDHAKTSMEPAVASCVEPVVETVALMIDKHLEESAPVVITTNPVVKRDVQTRSG